MAGDRAILFPLRVTGTAEAAQAFKSVGEAATKSIGDVAKAAAAQAQYEAAVVRAHTSSAVLGAAQAQANQQLSAAKAAFAGGTMSAEAYATSQLEVKNSLALVKAEQAAATAGLKNSSAALVAARDSAAGLSPALIVAGRSAGQTRAGFQQLGFQINDVTTQLSMGTPAMQVFAQQSGQVLQSVNLLAGGAGKFAAFMGGAWGLGLTIGISLLGLLGSKLFDTSDEADKLSDKTLTLHDALQKSAMGTDEARKALIEYNAEQDKARKNTEDMIKLNLADAESRLKQALSTREQIKAELDRQAAFGSDPRNFSGEGDAMSQGSVTAREQSKLEAQDKLIGELKTTIGNLGIQNATRNAKGALDPATGINQKYDDLAAAATRAAAGNVKLTAALEGTLIAQGKSRKAELDHQRELEQQERKTKRGGTSSSGQNDLGQMTALLQKLGFTVAHTTDGKHTAGSEHYAGRAIDFVPKGGMGQSSKAEVEKLLADAGVQFSYGTKGVKQFFGPGDKGHSDHFHVGFTGAPDPDKGMAAVERKAEEAAKQAEAQRQRDIRRAEQFSAALAGADNSLLDARRANVHEAAQLAAIDRQDVATAREKSLDEIAAKEQLGDYTKLQADQLREKADQTAAERLITIDTRETQRLADEKLQLSEGEINNQRDLLEAQLALVQTAGERRTIQLQLLALDKQSEKLALERVLADQAATDGAKANAAAALRQLDTKYALRAQSTLRGSAGPGESYIRDLNRTPAQMNEALEQVKVNGLKSLNDGLVDALTNFRSLGDVAQNVLRSVLHDLVALEVEKYITAPLANKLFPDQAAAANDNAAQLTAAGGEMIAAGGVLTGAATLWAATATQIQLAAASLAASGGGVGSGGSGGGNPLGMLFDAVLGGGSGGGGGLGADVAATIAANPGVFAAGTDMLPIGKPFFVGENGREKMINRGGGRVEVINGPRTHRAAQEGGGGVTIVQNNYIPERVDPRRAADGIARSTQGALARANRKGLAMTRGRN